MARRAALVAALLSCLVPAAARAATIPVSTGADGVANDGQCTLREAIAAASGDTPVGGCPAGSGADEVTLPATTLTLSVPGSDETNAGGDLDVTAGVVTIRGGGAAATTIDGAGIDRVLDVKAGATATLSDVTVTGGAAPNGGDAADVFATSPGGNVSGAVGNTAADGGGIRNLGTLTVGDAVVRDNRAGAGGAGSDAFGGNCTDFVTPQCAAGQAGGDATAGSGGIGGRGGGISSWGPLTVIRTRISGNVAGAGGRGGNATGGVGDNDAGGAGGEGGEATAGDGGPAGPGGGIWAGDALTVRASTITANTGGAGGNGGNATGARGGLGSTGGSGGFGTAATGGAPGNGGGIAAVGAATIEDSAITANTAGAGGQGGDATGGNGGNGTSTAGAGRAAFGGTGGAAADGGGLHASDAAVDRALVASNAAGTGGPGGDATTGLNGTGPGSPIIGGGLGGSGGRGGDGGGVSTAGRLGDVTLHGNGGGAGGNGGAGSAGFVGANGSGGDAGDGGGVHHDGALALTIRRATATANALASPGVAGAGAVPAGTSGDAGLGPGLRNSSGTIVLAESIVSESGSAACSGTIDDGGNDIRFPANGCPGVTTDPLLDPLADNGGPTPTRALKPASPAIDIILCAGSDQRGVSRPAGPRCDSGAYEFAPPGVSADAATDIGATSATLRAGIVANARPTSVRFEYGQTLAYGSTTPEQPAGTGTAATTITSGVGALTPFTTYHFRAVATNGDGSTTGPDGTFTTALLAPGGGGPGGGTGGPSGGTGGLTAAQLRAAVAKGVSDAIKALRRKGARALGAAGSVVVPVTVPGAGTWTIVIVAPDAKTKAARVSLGRARTTFNSKGSKRLRVKFTRAGRRVLRSTRKRVKLNITVTYAPTGAQAVKRTQSVTLKR